MCASPPRFAFKWIDNPPFAGDLMTVYADGDAAPNSRFAYLFRARS